MSAKSRQATAAKNRMCAVNAEATAAMRRRTENITRSEPQSPMGVQEPAPRRPGSFEQQQITWSATAGYHSVNRKICGVAKAAPGGDMMGGVSSAYNLKV